MSEITPVSLTAEAPAPETPENTQENTEGQAEGTAETAASSTEQKAAEKDLKKQLKKLKIKVDNKEETVEFDPNDDDFITKQIQLARMGQKRAGEKAGLEKEVAKFLSALQKDPFAALSDPDLKIDIEGEVRKYIERKIAESQKSPEELEREKLQTELKTEREARQKQEEEYKQRELSRIQEQHYERYDMLVSQALEKSELPKTPYVVKKIADYMLLGLQEGMDVLPEDVLPLVREEMQNDLREMFSAMPEEVVEKIVGKDVINKIRKKSVAAAKAVPPTPVKSAVKDTGQKAEDKKDKEKMTIKAFFGV